MTTVTFCENCNEDGQGIVQCRVTVKVSLDSESTSYDHWVCPSCANCIAGLDFDAYQKRHDDRPRKMVLP